MIKRVDSLCIIFNKFQRSVIIGLNQNIWVLHLLDLVIFKYLGKIVNFNQTGKSCNAQTAVLGYHIVKVCQRREKVINLRRVVDLSKQAIVIESNLLKRVSDILVDYCIELFLIKDYLIDASGLWGDNKILSKKALSQKSIKIILNGSLFALNKDLRVRRKLGQNRLGLKLVKQLQ